MLKEAKFNVKVECDQDFISHSFFHEEGNCAGLCTHTQSGLDQCGGALVNRYFQLRLL